MTYLAFLIHWNMSDDSEACRPTEVHKTLVIRSAIDGFSTQHWNCAYILRQWVLDYLLRAMKEVAGTIESGSRATSVPDYFTLYWRKDAPQILTDAGRAASVRNAPAPMQVGGWSHHPTALAMQATTERIEGKHTVIKLEAQNDNPAAYVTQASPLSFPRVYTKLPLWQLRAVCDRAKDQARSQALMLEMQAANWKGVDWTAVNAPGVTVPAPVSLPVIVTAPAPANDFVVFAAKYGPPDAWFTRLGVVPRGDAAFLWDNEGMDCIDPKEGSAEVRMWEQGDAVPLNGGISLDMARLTPFLLMASTELVTEVQHAVVDGALIIEEAEWKDVQAKLAADNDHRPAKKPRTAKKPRKEVVVCQERCDLCDCLLVINSGGKPVCRVMECVQDIRAKGTYRVYGSFDQLKGAKTWEQCMAAH